MPRLTDRDHLLIGFLALARYLTSKQLARLVFPGKAESTASGRLNQLAEASDPYAPLSRLSYRTYEGKIVVVWTLTKVGYRIAEELVGEVKVPRQDIGSDFLEHSTTCSQLFVYLAQKQSRTDAAELPTRFRWLASEGQGYPYGEYDQVHGKRRDRLLQPDAVLEVPLARRRFFIELEMGTHPITSANEEKAGATLAKVDRYDQFLHGFADVAGKDTWYAKSFSDRFTAELLFVVKSPKRRDNVNEALAEKRKGRVGPQPAVRALTLSDASRELRELVGAPPRTTEERPFPPPQPTAPPPPSVPLITERELHVLLNAHTSFLDIVHRQHELHRSITKDGKAPPFPFEPYPKETNEAAEVLDAIYQRLVAAKKKGN